MLPFPLIFSKNKLIHISHIPNSCLIPVDLLTLAMLGQ
jgi:hypothetical protein